jgi:hypothetical protein
VLGKKIYQTSSAQSQWIEGESNAGQVLLLVAGATPGDTVSRGLNRAREHT